MKTREEGELRWQPLPWVMWRQRLNDQRDVWCGSKLNDRRGKLQVLVHVSTYQDSVLGPVF